MISVPRVELLIFQTTPFCNIDCRYCYLPNRKAKQRISPLTVSIAARQVAEAGWFGDRMSVVWHAGEPLAVGREHLERLVDACAPLQKVTNIQHSVQTNATLLDKEFCDFFKRKRIRIGVSIDGPRDIHDRYRVTRAGKGTFDAVMRGIDRLRESEMDFSVICVLTSDSLDRAEEMYEFFHSIGASSVGFNVDELEGTNLSTSMDTDGYFERLSAFWDTMFRIHFERRAFQLREADTLVEAIRYGEPESANSQQVNPFAIITVGVDGSIGTFSPELLGQQDRRYGNFSIGNIISQGLREITANPRFQAMKAEIEAGVRRCSEECSYYELCGGGAPSNKIAERGAFDVTETKYCRSTKKVVVDSMLRVGSLYRAVAAAKSNESGVWTIPNALDTETCRTFISKATTETSNLGSWEASNVASEEPPTRAVKRADVDGLPILSAIRYALPERVDQLSLRRLSNERMIWLRYLPGDSFPIHTDSPYIVNEKAYSLFTVMIYLNDNFEGGETYFPDSGILVRPQAGMALIFAHRVRHEGLRLISGIKYALHTFVIYDRD